VCTQGRSTCDKIEKGAKNEWYLGYKSPYQLRYFHHSVRVRYDEGAGSPKSSLESPIIKNRAHSRTRIVCSPRNLTALCEMVPVQDIARPQSLWARLLWIRRHG
jgi:hypothetical protein